MSRNPLLKFVISLAIAFLLVGVNGMITTLAAAQSMRALSCTINTYTYYEGAGATAVIYQYHSDCGYFGSGNVGVADWANYCDVNGWQYEATQADPWTTNQPWYGGSRYNDPGRSSLVGVPSDCAHNYFLRQTNGGSTPGPRWGCSWYNFQGQAVYGSVDDLCWFIQS